MKSSTYRSATTKCAGKVVRQCEIVYNLLNTIMALAVLRERDFVGEGGAQSCGCGTAQGDQQ